MEGEGKKRKNGIELDWVRLLGAEGNHEEEEEPLHFEVIIQNQQSAGKPVSVAVAMETDEEQSQRIDNLKRMPDKELLAAIESSKATLRATTARLKDGGMKLRTQIKLYEDELERRRSLPVRKDDDGCNKPTQSQSKSCFNICDDFQEDALTSLPYTESSLFASRFCCKMDEKEELCTFKRCDSGKMRSTGILSRGRKKKGVSSRETPFTSTGNLLIDVDKQTLRNIDKKDGYLSPCSPHCPNEDLPSLSAIKRMRASRVQTLHQLRHNKGEPVVLDDEDETEVKEIAPHANVIDECADKNIRIYFPSRDDPEAVEISYTDMQCLDPEAYLSSTIMNFYIRYLWSLMPTDCGRYNYHFFNTYFYEKLKEAVQRGSSKETSFTKFRRWWKGVNIFEKAYILLPIHEDLHWSLVIICIPDKEDRFGLMLLHLDSLGLHHSESIFRNIKRFLIEEWEYLNERIVQLDISIQDAVWENLPRRIHQKVPEVPRQGNDYDCGLFVLYFMKRFIEEAPERLKMDDPSNILRKIGRKWFSPLEPSVLRQEIKAILRQQFKAASKSKFWIPCFSGESQLQVESTSVSRF